VKSVLISIQPKWCSLIASGQKTVEVRKTKPKLETPFKVYIYCTKSKKKTRIDWLDKALGGGMVIGEFVCDRIPKIVMYDGCLVDVVDCETSCLSAKEILEYSSGNPLYGWHISELVIYDKPKPLNEFTKPYGTIVRAFDSPFIQRAPQSWCYVEG
jgi:predicted transcriptional regulator